MTPSSKYAQVVIFVLAEYYSAFSTNQEVAYLKDPDSIRI